MNEWGAADPIDVTRRRWRIHARELRPKSSVEPMVDGPAADRERDLDAQPVERAEKGGGIVVQHEAQSLLVWRQCDVARLGPARVAQVHEQAGIRYLGSAKVHLSSYLTHGVTLEQFW